MRFLAQSFALVNAFWKSAARDNVVELQVSDKKRFTASRVVTKASAVSGPTPGAVFNRSTTASLWAIVSVCCSTAANGPVYRSASVKSN